MGVEYLIGKIRQHFCLIFVDILVELTNTVVEAKIQVTHSVQGRYIQRYMVFKIRGVAMDCKPKSQKVCAQQNPYFVYVQTCTRIQRGRVRAGLQDQEGPGQPSFAMLDGGRREGRGGLAAPSQLGTGQSTGGGSAGHYSQPTPRSP